MTALRWTGRMLRYDQRTFWRTPQAAFFTLVMPILMLSIFGALNRDSEVDQLGGVSFVRYLLVGQVAFVLIGTAYGNLAARFTFRRESGIYQRLRTTPIPACTLIAGQVLSALVVVGLTLTLLLAVGGLLYDVALPQRWPAFVLVVALGAACCCTLGIAVSTFVRSAEAIDPVIWATMLPIAFISGTFQYVEPGSALGRLAAVFPIRHIVLATLDTFGLGVGGDLWRHLAVVVAWAVGGAIVAVRRFQWAPSRG